MFDLFCQSHDVHLIISISINVRLYRKLTLSNPRGRTMGSREPRSADGRIKEAPRADVDSHDDNGDAKDKTESDFALRKAPAELDFQIPPTSPPAMKRAAMRRSTRPDSA